MNFLLTSWRKCASVADVSQSDLIGTAEAAEILGWSRAKTKREAQAGRLPHAVKMPGETGAYLFRRRDVERLAERRAS